MILDVEVSAMNILAGIFILFLDMGFEECLHQPAPLQFTDLWIHLLFQLTLQVSTVSLSPEVNSRRVQM